MNGRKFVFLRVELGPGRAHFFSRKRPQRMGRKNFALRAPKDLGLRPPDQGTPSRTLTPVTLAGRRHPECPGLGCSC